MVAREPDGVVGGRKISGGVWTSCHMEETRIKRSKGGVQGAEDIRRQVHKKIRYQKEEDVAMKGAG